MNVFEEISRHGQRGRLEDTPMQGGEVHPDKELIIIVQEPMETQFH